MPERRFYPYAYASDSLAVQVHKVAVDGTLVELSEVYSPEKLHLGLAGRTMERGLELQLSVSDQSNDLGDVVHDNENPAAALAVVLRLYVPTTRTRRLITCSPSGPGRWDAAVSIPAAALADRAFLEPLAVRTTRNDASAGKATRKGEEVAGGGRLIVELDRRPLLPGNAMDAEWRDFAAADSPDELKLRKDLAWFLDLSRPDHPKLLLNEGLSGFRNALEAPAVAGQAARVRDALIAAVLQPVLLALAMEALSTSAPGTEEEGEETPEDGFEGWRRDVLFTLAGCAGEATEELQVARWRQASAGDRGVLHLGLQTAIQRHLNLGDGIVGLLRVFEGGTNA